MKRRYPFYYGILTRFVLVFLICLGGNGISQDVSSPAYQNPQASVEERVEDLLSRMTIEEKIDMLSGIHHFDSKANVRLGIPAMKMTDGPVGVRWGNATAFPAGVAMAASWDPNLVEKIGQAIAREAKARGRNVQLAPCVNIHRVPHSGRNFESFGEDPFLASRIAVAYMNGIQSEKVISTIKHFACNNQEYRRGTIDMKVDERTLHEIYLPAFKAAVQEAGCWSVMGAYNKLNGDYCCENHNLLTEILKKRWGFQGFVMSDWNAVHSTVKTANAGIDLEMPSGKYLGRKDILKAVKQGKVNESTVNDKIRRILRAMFSMGFFDRVEADPGALDTPEHRQLALKAAQAGIVLLKNEGNLLPLDQNKIRSIAVIGPNAAFCRTGGGGSSFVSPFYSVSPLKGIQRKVEDKIEICYAAGTLMKNDFLPIESPYLKPPNGNSNEQGLLAEYFDNIEFKGDPVIRRIDKQVNFRWGTLAPANGIPPDSFSIRWTGKMISPETGKYILSVTSDDGTRLYLDDRLLIDSWGIHADLTKTAIVELEKGKSYNIKMEYFENAGRATAILGWMEISDNYLENAVEIAKKSDVAIVFVGLSDNFETEGQDRENLSLPSGQDELITAVVRVNSKTIVVLNSGAAVLMNEWIDKIPSILEAWYPGQEGGNAVADILFGDFNPCGKLPTTFIKNWEDSPAYKNYPGKNDVVNYNEGIFVGYRHFDKKQIEPLFPFGHGLSYTNFGYDDLQVTPKTIKQGDKLEVSFELENKGPREGAEVVQLYISDAKSSVDRPPKELKSFKKVHLKPQEKQLIHFTLDQSVLSYYDVDQKNWVAEPGMFQVLIGSSSKDIRLKGEFELK